MLNKKLFVTSFLSALGVTIYVVLVSLLLQNGEKIFGKINNFFGPTMLLLLFVLSAAVTGAFVLGRPVMLYFENRKPEAIKLFFCTLAWLFVFVLIIFAILLLI